MQSGFKVKISDFGKLKKKIPKILGMSRKITDPNQGNKTKNETGPLKWYCPWVLLLMNRMAPEQLSTKKYSIKTDSWAFGITLFGIHIILTS
jgi:serine/threonine protein kinase